MMEFSIIDDWQGSKYGSAVLQKNILWKGSYQNYFFSKEGERLLHFVFTFSQRCEIINKLMQMQN